MRERERRRLYYRICKSACELLYSCQVELSHVAVCFRAGFKSVPFDICLVVGLEQWLCAAVWLTNLQPCKFVYEYVRECNNDDEDTN